MTPADDGSPNEDSHLTQPLGSDHPTRRIETPDGFPVPAPQKRRCLAGHDQPNNPTWHPTLGLVPAMTSVVFGAAVVGLLLALQVWLVPGWIIWTLAILIASLAVSGAIQLATGHRGRCWLWRTLRWWLGPIGTLVDPFQGG